MNNKEADEKRAFFSEIGIVANNSDLGIMNNKKADKKQHFFLKSRLK